jgi:YjbE family integral membrane protein
MFDTPFAFDLATLSALAGIVLIDLVLAGDNAVVIALAVKNLPRQKRLLGIALGAGGAVAVRVALTFFAANLLDVPLVKLLGGLLIAWIGVKLFVEGCPEEGCRKECKTVWQAMTTILVADLVMSTDNILAVAGASDGRLALLVFGLGLSIPLVVFASSLLTRLLDRFPALIYLGAAVLGKVAAEMILTDPLVARNLEPSSLAIHLAEFGAALGVVMAGRFWVRLSRMRTAPIVLDAGNRRLREP